MKEESETDDPAELESFLYSQIHYMEDNPQEVTSPHSHDESCDVFLY